VSGSGRADIIVRSEQPIHQLAFTVSSPIRTTFTASAGAGEWTGALTPGQPVSFVLPVSDVRGLNSYACLLSAQSSDGFIEHLRDPNSRDYRNLGVLMTFGPAPAPAATGATAPARQ
jgi:hypothetical protein